MIKLRKLILALLVTVALMFVACDNAKVCEHQFEVFEVISEATCTEDGEEKYTCSRCKNSYTKKLDALGHDWGEEEELEATCLDDGYKRKTCNSIVNRNN